MNPAQVAIVVSQMVSLLNAGLTLAANSQKYRDMVAKAVVKAATCHPKNWNPYATMHKQR